MSSIAIIPARGGSKRIPRKNFRDFCGQPMIKYPIDAALESGIFDRVIVSTDCEQIAAVARSCGAETPFMRPGEFSDDKASMISVFRHAIDSISKAGETPDVAFGLFATAPFLTSTQIKEAYSRLIASPDADFILAVTTFPSPPQRAFCTDQSGMIQFQWPEHFDAHSQNLPETFHDAGLFVGGKTASFFEYDSALLGNCLPFRVERQMCQDIDDAEDWLIAEALYRQMQK